MLTRCALVLALGLLATAASAQEAPGWNQSPDAGTLTLDAGFSDDPRTLAVRPGGSYANPLSGSGCRGYLGSRPDVVVEYRAGSWDLTFSAASDTDLTLVVRDPTGRYTCDDDSGEGTNPVLTVESPRSGRYAVWVGTYGQASGVVDGVFGVSEVGSTVDGRSVPSSAPSWDGGIETGAIANEVPGWNQPPYAGTLSLSSGYSGDPRTVTVTAGGPIANPIQGGGCNGYLSDRPLVVVDYRAGSYDLTFSAASTTDLTLVVRDPDGDYICDDDSGEGTNPVLTVPNSSSGRYTLWVGVFGASDDYVDAVVGVSEIAAEVSYDGPGRGSMGASTPPPRGGTSSGEIAGWEQRPTSGTAMLFTDFTPDPWLDGVYAGGPTPNPLEGTDCNGYVASAPTYAVNYRLRRGYSPGTLTVSAAADADLTLVVRTPSGRYLCDDDGGDGYDPRIDTNDPAEVGVYVIWVGTYSAQPGTVEATIGVSNSGRLAE